MADEQDMLFDDEGNPIEPPVVVEDPPENEETERDGVESSSGDSDEETELAAAGSDDEREAIRVRRREERKLRKQRQHDREDTLRRELAARDAVINQLSERLNHIDRRNNGFDLAQLENGMQQLNVAYTVERDRVAKATAAGNGDEAAAGTERMMQIRERFNQLQAAKQAYAQTVNAPPPLDPRIREYGDEWASRNKWYKPTGNDIQSRITRVIDDALVQEGWDPTTKEYWNELDRRVKDQGFNRQNGNGNGQGNRQNGHFGQGGQHDDGQRRNSSAPPMAGSGSNANAGKGGYVLSAARVAALKDAGLWDDPAKRKAAIENYKRYDQENGAR